MRFFVECLSKFILRKTDISHFAELIIIHISYFYILSSILILPFISDFSKASSSAKALLRMTTRSL